MKKEKLSVKEFVWYCIASVIAIFGIILIVFGVIGHHLDVSLDSNFVKNAEKALIDAIHIPFDFRIWGVMFLLLGVAILLVVLTYFARKVDRENERTIRRQQRLASARTDAAEVKAAVQVVEEAPAPEVKPEQ